MSWLPKKRIVVPIDMSEFSLAALDTAVELVDSPGNLHVVHVLPEISAMDPGVVWGEVDDNSRRIHAEKGIREMLAKRGLSEANVEVLVGAAAHQISHYCREVQPDLLVIHSHGRTGAAHVFIGSVAERVVRHVHCPVLVLKD